MLCAELSTWHAVCFYRDGRTKFPLRQKYIMLNKPKTILSLLATCLITCALFSQRVHAVPIDGTVGFSGLGSATAGPTTTTINFSNPLHTIYGSDDYSVVPFGTPVTFKSIAYGGTGEGATLTGSVTSLWTFNVGSTIYSFDLTNLVSATRTSNSLILAGLGTANITGFDPTPGNFAIQGTGRNLSLQFVSASTTASYVPDGGMTVSLLGLALAGLAGLRRTLWSASKTA
jgi:hypothetical protein